MRNLYTCVCFLIVYFFLSADFSESLIKFKDIINESGGFF